MPEDDAFYDNSENNELLTKDVAGNNMPSGTLPIKTATTARSVLVLLMLFVVFFFNYLVFFSLVYIAHRISYGLSFILFSIYFFFLSQDFCGFFFIWLCSLFCIIHGFFFSFYQVFFTVFF